MALTTQQKVQVAAFFANAAFSQSVVANFSTDDIAAAATALDNALDTSLSTAVTAVGGATTVINGLAAIIPAPFSGATVGQKSLLLCHVLMKRAGLI